MSAVVPDASTVNVSISRERMGRMTTTPADQKTPLEAEAELCIDQDINDNCLGGMASVCKTN